VTSEPPVRIHRVGPEDASLVHRAAALFDEAPRDEAIARFLGSDDHHLLLALEGAEPVGFVSGVELTHPDKGVEMFLYELAVAEDARRRGIGRALVEALAELARERGCRGMWVLTDEDNVAAVTTYRRAGATRDERTFLLEWTF
jgi:ribosomal protein S18 acetylase RimI-like enzyme